MLNLENISAYYGDVQVLRNISLRIKERQVISIIGSNGAGKTTTLNIISGVHQPSSGTIEFLGSKIENLPSHQIVDLGVVQIPEARLLFPFMTGPGKPGAGFLYSQSQEGKERKT